VSERRQRIDRQHRLPVTHQCRLLELSHASVYYTPVPVGEEELTLMRRLDELHLLYPFMGSRKLRDVLRNEGIKINRKRVQRLMQKMGIVIPPKNNRSYK
jgi:putative transposase